MAMLEMLNINKSFKNVQALDNVSLVVDKGEIHGLIGENGAGKSTLMNILYGIHQPDSGTIKLFGKETTVRSPLDAIKHSVGMVHQHFMISPSLTALQNICLGNSAGDKFFVNKSAARKKTQEIMDKYSLHVDLDCPAFQLSVGEKQRVEIIKALYRGAKLLILDEPTAVLTPPEIKDLMRVLTQLRDGGCSIIFITHKLKEIFAVASKITVMRKGKLVGEVIAKNTNEEELSKMMVGHLVNTDLPRGEYNPGKKILEIKNVYAKNVRNMLAVKGVSFDVHSGEIVGIAGVEGNGQTEIAELISGQIAMEKGDVLLSGKSISKKSIRKRRQLGLSHIPEDRLKVGGAKDCSIEDNIIINRYYQPPYSRFGITDKKKVSELAENLVKKYTVKTPNTKLTLGSLSGGNMQKVIYAREIETDPDLLIAAQPTRGVDIGAIEFMHSELLRLRDAGKGVLLISAELSEIFALSDRILVMYEGEIVGSFKRGEIDEERIGQYMTGVKRDTVKAGGK